MIISIKILVAWNNSRLLLCASKSKSSCLQPLVTQPSICRIISLFECTFNCASPCSNNYPFKTSHARAHCRTRGSSKRKWKKWKTITTTSGFPITVSTCSSTTFYRPKVMWDDTLSSVHLRITFFFCLCIFLILNHFIFCLVQQHL